MSNIELNNKLFGNNSISIILKQFKEEHISESEAVQLIEDLYRNRWPYYVPYTPWPQITYDNNFPKYEVTCTQK